MPGFRLPFRMSDAMGESLAELPEAVKSVIKRGFKVHGRISEETLRALIEAAGQGLAGRDVDATALARQFGLEATDVGEMLGATSIMLIAVAAENVSVDSFVNDAINAGIVDEADRVLVTQVANMVATDRGEIKTRLDREAVASRVLPALSSFQSSVEIRLAFKDDRLSLLVPVAVAHIDTDTTHVELWFQMSRAQVEKLADDLQQLLKRIAEAEKLIQQIKVP